MSDDRKEYTVTIGDLEHTLLLTSKDAERYGKNAVLSSTKPKPAPKTASKEGATPDNKDGAPPATK